MKIAFFTNTYRPHVGGVANSVHGFAENLRKQGHRVLIVAPQFPDTPEDETDILRVPAIQNFNGSDFSVKLPLALDISERLDTFKPDIIHSHHPFLLGDSALREARRQNCPICFTHHTLYERYTHYVPFDSELIRNLAIHLSTEYANLCDGVIAPSKSIADTIKKRGVDTPIKVIPTGIDLEFFQSGNRRGFRQKHGLGQDAPVVGHVGRLAEEKNLQYLARSVILAFKNEPHARFLVVGNGPEQQTIKKQFHDSGLQKQLITAGELSGQALADAYAAMDSFAFASTSETQGLVLAEAMASGKPVIALDAPGAREVVKDGHNGILLPEDSSEEAFASALKPLLSKLPGDMTQAAMETAKLFSDEHTTKTLLECYQERIQNHQPTDTYPEGMESWERFLVGIRTEWDLLSEKAAATLEAITNKSA